MNGCRRWPQATDWHNRPTQPAAAAADRARCGRPHEPCARGTTVHLRSRTDGRSDADIVVVGADILRRTDDVEAVARRHGRDERKGPAGLSMKAAFERSRSEPVLVHHEACVSRIGRQPVEGLGDLGRIRRGPRRAISPSPSTATGLPCSSGIATSSGSCRAPAASTLFNAAEPAICRAAPASSRA